jgi:hypothetical protein
MKMRIQANAIRFRLNRKEVADLAEAGQAQESVEFGPAVGQRLVYALEVDPELSSVTADYQEGKITVRLPRWQTREWLETERIGVDGEMTLGNGRSLRILVEKDFQCLHTETRETGDEFDPDAYPNPSADPNRQETRSE